MKNLMKRLVRGFLVVGFLAASLSAHAQAATIVYDDFESGTLDSGKWWSGGSAAFSSS